MPGILDGTKRLAFGLTEPNHGSDATYMETTAVSDGDEWVLNGAKRFNSGLHHATHDIVFARSSGRPGVALGHHRLPRPHRRAGLHRRVLLVDLQHADGPRRGHAVRTCGCRARRSSGRSGGASSWRSTSCTRTASAKRRPRSGPPSSASTRRSRTPTSGSRGAVPVRQPGHPVPPGGAAHGGRDAAAARALDGLDARSTSPHGGDALGSMCNYRANRLACDAAGPCHADVRWCRVQPAHAVRAHLPASPPLPHHRRQ